MGLQAGEDLTEPSFVLRERLVKQASAIGGEGARMVLLVADVQPTPDGNAAGVHQFFSHRPWSPSQASSRPPSRRPVLASTLRRDLYPMEARPRPYQHSPDVSAPGDNTPRIIKGQGTKVIPGSATNPGNRGHLER